MYFQSECLHKTVNMVVSLLKLMKNTYPKGRALMQMYIVVPITKRGNWFGCWCLSSYAYHSSLQLPCFWRQSSTL